MSDFKLFNHDRSAASLLSLTIATTFVINIYDSQAHHDRVVVEVCKAERCVSLLVKKEELEKPEVLDSLEKIIRNHLN